MRNRKRSFLLLTALSTSSLLLAIACGGGGAGDSKTPADKNTAASSSSGTTPSGSSGATDPGSSSGAGSSGSTAGGGSGTTTTTNLPDSGELQGAKLGGGHTKVEVETKGDAGPKTPAGGGSAGEPGRTAKDIQTIVAARRDDARACYDKALASHPGIEGDLDIRWKIDPQGNVTEAEVDTTKSSILEPTVAQCIIDIIKKIKFAPSPKGFESRAHYPFNFHPKPGQGGSAGAKDGGK
jgi:outer membrane biosynthesis protein TonB